MFFIQEDIIKMVPSRVDPNNKQESLQSIRRKKIPFILIEWQEVLIHFQVKLQFVMLRRHLENYIMNVLMKAKHSKFKKHAG
jgi:hypothetical protein